MLVINMIMRMIIASRRRRMACTLHFVAPRPFETLICTCTCPIK